MDVDLDAFRERVLVDKGAQDGVFVGQAVLDAGGVFGQVARVGQLTAEVILLSDATHAIPVQINRNGLRTIAVGTGDTSRLKLPYLPTSADVVAGDLLVTSGPRRRISRRLPGRHRRGGQARSRRSPLPKSTSSRPPPSIGRASSCSSGSNRSRPHTAKPTAAAPPAQATARPPSATAKPAPAAPPAGAHTP